MNDDLSFVHQANPHSWLLVADDLHDQAIAHVRRRGQSTLTELDRFGRVVDRWDGLTSDDVIDMFLTWLHTYSELHFTVIGDLYQHPGSTRGGIWRRIGSGPAREDSAEADLYKLLFRDLSTGSVIRQHREVDYSGNFVAKKKAPSRPAGSGPAPMKSAFDDEEAYELTSLGQQFVHYAMTELPPKLTFTPASS
jgi:hypothetical protein